jgi:hypothetical protein
MLTLVDGSQGKARASACPRRGWPSSPGTPQRAATRREGDGKCILTRPCSAGGTQRLTRTVGTPMAKRLIFTGEELGPAAALAAGTVAVFPPPTSLLLSR